MLVYKWTPYFLSLNWFLRFTICINELTAVRQDGSAFSGGGITAWQWHLRNTPNGTLMYWHVLHIKTLLFLIPLTARNFCLITNICLGRSVLPLRKLSSDEFSYFSAENSSDYMQLLWSQRALKFPVSSTLSQAEPSLSDEKIILPPCVCKCSLWLVLYFRFNFIALVYTIILFA